MALVELYQEYESITSLLSTKLQSVDWHYSSLQIFQWNNMGHNKISWL